MQTTQAIPVLHTTKGTQVEQKVPVDAMEFAAQLTESMQKNGQQVLEQVESETVQQVEVFGNEMDQDTEQSNSVEDQVDPKLAAFFYQPLKMAEQQLTAHLEPQGDTVETEIVSRDGSLESLLENRRAVEEFSGEPVEKNTNVFRIDQEPKASQPVILQATESEMGQAASIPQNSEAVVHTPAHTMGKNFDDSLTREPNAVNLFSTNKLENSLFPEMDVTVKNTVLPELEPVIEEFTVEQTTEKMPTGQDDLDIQSQLRMKVSPSFADQVVAAPAQSVVPQKEAAFPVRLTSESSSVNQQVLTQAVSEVIFEQSAGMKEGHQTTARLRLTPESLGNMKIEIQIREQQLYTTIVVESTETKELMDNSMKQLSASLAQKNIQLQEMTVQINLPQTTDFSFAGSSQQEAGKNQNNAFLDGVTEPLEQANQTVLEDETTASTGRLSILA